MLDRLFNIVIICLVCGTGGWVGGATRHASLGRPDDVSNRNLSSFSLALWEGANLALPCEPSAAPDRQVAKVCRSSQLYVDCEFEGWPSWRVVTVKDGGRVFI